MDWVYQRGLVLSTVRGAFFDASGVFGGLRPAPSVSFHSLFIVVSFLLNEVFRVGTCPISHSLQLLEVVVKTEKYGCVRHKALNAIMAAFPLDTSIFSVVLFCFSTFPIPWNDLECHYQWQVAPFILGYIHAKEESPHGRGGVFPWAGPLAQCRHWHGPPSLLPPTTCVMFSYVCTILSHSTYCDLLIYIYIYIYLFLFLFYFILFLRFWFMKVCNSLCSSLAPQTRKIILKLTKLLGTIKIQRFGIYSILLHK